MNRIDWDKVFRALDRWAGKNFILPHDYEYRQKLAELVETELKRPRRTRGGKAKKA